MKRLPQEAVFYLATVLKKELRVEEERLLLNLLPVCTLYILFGLILKSI